VAADVLARALLRAALSEAPFQRRRVLESDEITALGSVH